MTTSSSVPIALVHTQAEAAIRLKNVSKAYKIFDKPINFLKEALTGHPYHREKHALRDITLTIHTGQIVGIIGRNGAGKSTLLKILAGTLAASQGSVEVRGRVSAILELGTGFNPNYSGRDNVILSALMRGMPEEAVRAKFDSIVAFAGFEDVIDEPFHTYSSGMQSRLAFAAAVAVDANVLIIDEALSTGDIRFAAKSLRRIHEICQSGVTALFVSHVTYHVMQLCNRVVWIDDGSIRMDGDPIEVVRAYEYEMHDAIASDQGRVIQPRVVATQIVNRSAGTKEFSDEFSPPLEQPLGEELPTHPSRIGLLSPASHDNMAPVMDNVGPISARDTCRDAVVGKSTPDVLTVTRSRVISDIACDIATEPTAEEVESRQVANEVVSRIAITPESSEASRTLPESALTDGSPPVGMPFTRVCNNAALSMYNADIVGAQTPSTGAITNSPADVLRAPALDVVSEIGPDVAKEPGARIEPEFPLESGPPVASKTLVASPRQAGIEERVPMVEIEGYRFTTGQYHILDVTFLDKDGCPTDVFRFGEPLYLRVSYECLLPHLPEFSCGVAVAFNRISDFEAVMYFNTNYPHTDDELRDYFAAPFRKFIGQRGVVEQPASIHCN